MTKQQIFAAKIKELVRQAQVMEDDAVGRVIALLEDTRKEVIAQITSASTDWQAYQLPRLKAAIEKEIRNFQVMGSNNLASIQTEFWKYGANMVDLPLQAIGFTRLLPSIDPALLGILQDYSADLVTGLTNDAIKKVNGELARALLGQKTPFEAMKAIGMNLDSPSVFRSIAKRAEVITRTEGSRCLEAAHQARREKAAGVIPGLKKVWRHSLYVKNPREGHLDAVGQTVDYDKPFKISPTIGGVIEDLMWPKDPAGSPENTINCDCYTEDWHENWDTVVEKQGEMAMPDIKIG
jgi:hypothetical protein